MTRLRDRDRQRKKGHRCQFLRIRKANMKKVNNKKLRRYVRRFSKISLVCYGTASRLQSCFDFESHSMICVHTCDHGLQSQTEGKLDEASCLRQTSLAYHVEYRRISNSWRYQFTVYYMYQTIWIGVICIAFYSIPNRRVVTRKRRSIDTTNSHFRRKHSRLFLKSSKSLQSD